MREARADVVIIGSGAGGGTVAHRVAPLVRAGKRVLVLEQGPRLDDHEFTGNEIDMGPALFEDAGGLLTAEGTMTLAIGRAYGGSTAVYTGVSLIAPERVIAGWQVPALTYADVRQRALGYARDNNVHLLADDAINENNRLFVEGCTKAGYTCHQFPVNVDGCLGSGLCNLGCPNGAKQGTNRVQLPQAELAGVEVVTRATALRLEERAVVLEVAAKEPHTKGQPSTWEPGTYRVRADSIVVAGGAVGSSALLLRSGFGAQLPRLGRSFTCHPSIILVGEHDRPITNDVGHPKSFYLDRAETEGYVLETCMYFPFTTAKNLTGFGPAHRGLMHAFPRLQMILVLACDKPVPENRITVDRAGKPVVHYHFTPEVIARLVAASRTASEILFAAGALRVHAPTAYPPLLERTEAAQLSARIRPEHFLPGTVSVAAAHMMGGCAMGRDATDSVTDAWGRVHGIPWLRVADASLFPDSVEINPYLTIMALADRVAEGILDGCPATAGAP